MSLRSGSRRWIIQGRAVPGNDAGSVSETKPMSKKTNKAKQDARRKPKIRRNAHKRRKNSVGSFAGFNPAPMAPEDFNKLALRLISDQILLLALKQTGIRDAVVNLLVERLAKDETGEPDLNSVQEHVEPQDSGGANKAQD
jgi:hypothetical protein